MSRLGVAFLWHMHQPCYREPDSRVFRLPWVRLHGLKDYQDMLEMALGFPELKVTFNLVPALVEQIEAYAQGSATDQHLELTRRPAADLSEAETCFLLQEFFMANWENMIRPNPRYWELLNKRGQFFHTSQLQSLSKRFRTQDLLDLQVWFNLAWTDPIHLERDPVLSELHAKGRGYTEQDKEAMLERQQAILESIIPSYRRAAGSGQIELSTSPFYHPILPLLCDTDVARECMPQAQLPPRFTYPQDAAEQVSRALDFIEDRFGHRPKGFWPSEGSVSQETMEILDRYRIEWLATDEGILEKSLGRQLRSGPEVAERDALYRPYRLSAEGPAIFFRDRLLSDLIGFTYASWKPDEAAGDLVGRLEAIADDLGARAEGHLVPIILDGENAWESYLQDGRPFLEAVYSKIAASVKLKACTFKGFLESPKSTCGRLERIYPGSWINRDFAIWIGPKEDNVAWELLGQLRRDFEGAGQDQKARGKAYQEILIAEGSDWCWWYGGNFGSEHLAEFDSLFRSHIIQAYRLLELPVPVAALNPIASAATSERMVREPAGMISPTIDGQSTNFYEWSSAGKIDTSIQGGTMHRSRSLIKNLYYGSDQKNLYLRLDPGEELTKEEYPELNISVEFVKPEIKKIKIEILEKPQASDGINWSYDKVMEIAIPFRDIGANKGDLLYFSVAVRSDSIELERHPNITVIKFKVPDFDFVLNDWQV